MAQPFFYFLVWYVGLCYILITKKLLNMKLFKFLFLFVFGITTFIACKKDKGNTTIPVADIAAPYAGKYGTGNNNPSSFFSFNVKAGGALEELNSSGGVIGTGTWNFSGNIFTAFYHYLTPATAFFSVKAVYDPSLKKLTGTWGYGASNNDGGKFYMTKK